MLSYLWLKVVAINFLHRFNRLVLGELELTFNIAGDIHILR
jgi:hypothetical protein